jgi:hypothetical protein
MKVKILNKTSNNIDIVTILNGIKYTNHLQPKNISPEYWFQIITADNCIITLKDATEDES